MNEMWSKLAEAGLTDSIKWSVLDRWHSHPAFIDALAGRVVKGLEQFEKQDHHKVNILEYRWVGREGGQRERVCQRCKLRQTVKKRERR